jgi:hypothetical protein
MNNLRIYIMAFATLFVSSLASKDAQAQSQIDEEVRLSQLTLSAFECSVLASDKKEAQRLFDIGLGAGRAFLDGLSKLTGDEDKAVSENTAILWNMVAGPTHDFILGQVYSDRIEEIYKYHDGDNKAWALKQEQMFRQKNCALIP